MKIKYVHTCFVAIVLMVAVGCKKQDDFLSQKPNQALSAITSLSDCQLLLQNEQIFNSSDPALGEVNCTDYYITPSTYNSLSSFPEIQQNSYKWAGSIYPPGSDVPDWTNAYSKVYYANNVLDALGKIEYPSSQQTLYNQIKGAALFFRAYSFYNLVQTFAMPYDSANAGTQLGIPLRLTSDLNAPISRASEKECYDQITNDLQTAITLLPTTSAYPTQPNQAAANGLLARVYLGKSSYANAFQYANACLLLRNQLADYNSVTPAASSLLTSGFFVEVIYHTKAIGYNVLTTNLLGIVDSTLYNSYSSNDLRKSIFFVLTSGLPYFRGNYDFSRNTCPGIATDEIYLIRAECYARMGNTSLAMTDLNTLMVKRYKTGFFVPYTAVDADDALKQILNERRKELLFRGLRWTDLRRLNKEPRFAVTLTRVFNGITYTLPPNDKRYALPIPDNEIAISGIQQNQR